MGSPAVHEHGKDQNSPVNTKSSPRVQFFPSHTHTRSLLETTLLMNCLTQGLIYHKKRGLTLGLGFKRRNSYKKY